MLPTEMPLYGLFKKTFSFFFNIDRLWKLSAFPFLFLILLSVAALLTPSTMAANGIQKVGNYYPLGAFLLVLLLILAMTMVRAHRLVSGKDDGKFYVPQFGRENAVYLWAFFKLTFLSAVLSFLLSGLVLALIHYFVPQMFVPTPYLILFFFVWMPFFMINQFCFLPAAAENEKISFKQGWGMLKGNRLPFCTTYIFVSAFPFIVTMFAGAVFTSLIPFGWVFLFFQFLLFEVALLLSCISQAVFMSYAYLALKR